MAAWMYLVSMPALILCPRATAGCALQVLAAAGLAEEFSVVDDHFASRHYGARVAFDSEALEHRVIDAHVVRFGADGVFGFGIPEHNVGVAAGRERSLARVHSEDASWRGGDQFDETV